MPELPEVESLRRDLAATLVGRTFTDIEVRLAKQVISPAGLTVADLIGKRIEGLRRRAKFLIFDLSDGLALVFHLRLAGQLVHRDSAGEKLAEGGHPVPAFGAPLPHRSTHVIFRFDDGSVLYLTDIRQFGRVWILPEDAVQPLLDEAKLGPEPLDPEFTEAVLRERVARRTKMPLKPLLLDQHVIGGVGNIYADEIIFESGLTPATRVGDLDDAGLARLHLAIKEILGMAVRDGVAEILNGKAAVGRSFPRVHGRAGQPCPRCGTTISKMRFAGRGTYTCPSCQPMGELTADESSADEFAGPRSGTNDEPAEPSRGEPLARPSRRSRTRA
jgi:formamidopyrimidine-DNA glycosylase